MAALSFAVSNVAQQSAEPQSSAVSATAQSKGCLVVKSAGSHAFRNIMLGGIAGALISKEQYVVLDVVDYSAKIGQKYHGNDLQTIQGGGTKVVILGKKATKKMR